MDWHIGRAGAICIPDLIPGSNGMSGLVIPYCMKVRKPSESLHGSLRCVKHGRGWIA
jgi:hypothetical protein